MSADSETVAIIDDLTARDLISVSWDSANICNYRCTYCDEWYNGGTQPFPDIEKVITFLTRLSQETGKRIYIEMKGGEPTYWKDISRFLDVCHANTWGVCLVTNASRPLEWWKENISKIPSVAISLHPESVKVEEVTEKLELIYGSVQNHSMYLMYPPLFEKAKRDLEYITERIPYLPLEAVVVAIPRSGNQLFSYTPEQEEFIRAFNARDKRALPPLKYPFAFPERSFGHLLNTRNETMRMNPQDVKLRSQNEWEGWRCTAGLNRIHIEVNGDIYRGQCRQGGKLGNLHAEDYVFPEDTVTCAQERCFCGAEMILRKWNAQLVSLER